MTAQVSLRLPEIKGFRDERGRFTSAQSAAFARNRRLAEILRAQAAIGVATRLVRPGESTGRLEQITADPRNSVADQFRVGVGNEEFLDRSEAKYWRTFEQGSAATWRRPFIGTQLFLVPGSSRRGNNDPGLRTANFELGGLLAKRGLYRVKREIRPAHVYRDLARSADLDEAALQMARRYFSDLFGS